MAKSNDPVEAEVVGERFTQYIITRRRRSGLFWGLVLIILGALLLVQQYLGINVWQYFWPVMIVAFGLWLIIRSF